MALPRMRAVENVNIYPSSETRSLGALTVNITLTLVCLRDEQIRHMAANVVLIADRVAAEDFLKSASSLVSTFPFASKISTYVLALISARSQFCLLIILIISGAALPSSFSLPTWCDAKMPYAASVTASDNFFCTS